MKTISHAKTLFCYDGPQVIEANNDDGQKHIDMMVEPLGVEERFVLKAVAQDRLDRFELAMVDLSSMFLERPEGEWFLGTVSSGFDEPFTLKGQTGPIDECRFLPTPGFFLSEPEEQKETPLGHETGGGSAGKPLEIGPPPMRREA
jgi:hypothetical protein